jgi:hypothetical protein
VVVVLIAEPPYSLKIAGAMSRYHNREPSVNNPAAFTIMRPGRGPMAVNMTSPITINGVSNGQAGTISGWTTSNAD